MRIMSKKMCIFARRNEVLSFHIILPISVPTCLVTGLGEVVGNWDFIPSCPLNF